MAGKDEGEEGAALSAEEARAVARLARIRLAPGEAEALAPELGAVLAMAARLRRVDAGDAEPMTTPAAGGLPLLDDKVARDADRAAALSGAPETAEGMFRVPKVVE